jgi:hypothetical protein
MNIVTVLLAGGVFLICGAFFRWRWLVDLPEEMSPYYSQALLKTIAGTKRVVWFTYFLGVLCIALALLKILQPYYPSVLGNR